MTSGSAVKSDIMSNQQLAEELPKAIIRKFGKWRVCSSFFGKWRVCSSFIENIWGGNVEDIRLISKFN